jgi:hypothetical protein
LLHNSWTGGTVARVWLWETERESCESKWHYDVIMDA